MKTKKLFLTALSILTAFTISACGLSGGTSGGTSPAAKAATTPGATAAASGDSKAVKVGVVMPLTGANAKFGEDSLNGVQLAADAINAAGGIKSMGGAKIQIVSRDATSDPSKAAAALQQMVSADKPVAIIGVYASGLTITAAPMAERLQVPLLTTGFADQLSTSGYKYLFQIAPWATEVGKAQLNYAIEISKTAGKQLKNVAIVYENDAFGTKSAEGVKIAAEAAGLKVVLDEGYPLSITDATPLANKIAAAKPDAIFPVSYLNDGILLIRALKQNKVTAPVVAGVGGFVTPDFLKTAGKDVVEGVLTVDISAQDGYGDIGKAYEAKYGMFMSQAAHDNAVAMDIIASALEVKPTTDPKVLGETLHAEEFTGTLAKQMPGGKVKFSDQGKNTVIKPVMEQWQNGKLVSVWPPDISKGKPNWP
jgi:branched-chain amino acid transport system substrate-binding protein